MKVPTPTIGTEALIKDVMVALSLSKHFSVSERANIEQALRIQWKQQPNTVDVYPVPRPVAFSETVFMKKTGEFRVPRKGEWYLSGAIPCAYQAPNDLLSNYHILERVK